MHLLSGPAPLHRSYVKWIALLMLGLLPKAHAQTSVDGAIAGTVLSPAGAAIANARIDIRNTSAAFNQQTTTQNDGTFLLPRIPPGDYQVTVKSTTSNPIILPHLAVELGQTTTLPIHLGPNATISVTPQEESTSTTTVLTATEIQQLPVNAQHWQTIALLTPTANTDQQGDGLLSFRGLAVTQNSTTLDGANNDQNYNSIPRGADSQTQEESSDEQQRQANDVGLSAGGRRHSGTNYTFAQEAVREMRIGAQDNTALYGHGSGGIITTISRGGSNDLHGTLLYRARDSAWASASPFSIATQYSNGVVTSGVVKPHDLRQQLGGSLGGALVQDKLFYFYAYDQQLRNFPAVSSPEDPAFYSLTATQRALLANRGVSASRVNTALNYLDSLTGAVARNSDQRIHFGKLEWQAAENHRLSVQYNRTRSSAPGALRTAPVVDRGMASLGSAYDKVDAGMARWLWIVSPRVTHEPRVAYGRDFEYQRPEAPLPQEPAVGPGGFAPEVAIGPDGLTFGTPAVLGRSAYPDEHRLQVADMVSVARGRHLLQVGFDFSLVHDLVDAVNNVDGTFHYDSGATNGHAGGLVDWITDYTFNVNAYPNGGCPSITASVHEFCFRSFTQSFGEQTVSFDTQEWAGFAQDSWRLRPGLMVNAGIRYEYQLLPLPQQPNPALDAAFGSVGATSVFPEDRNNFGPRVGVSWEPLGSGRGIVRAAFGVYYGNLPGATIKSALANTATGTSTMQVRITPSTVTNCPQVANQGFGYACSFVSTPPAAVGQTTSATVFGRRFRLPMIAEGSFAVEREMGAGFVASATYYLNAARQLANSVDINIAPSTGTKVFRLQGGTGAEGVRDGEMFVLPVYTARVNPEFGVVTDVVSNSNASFNALAVEARHRGRGGVEFRGSWTWAKTIDYGQAGASPALNSQMDPFDVAYDKGLSRMNVPHKVVASAVWEPRVHSAERWARRAGNDWTVSGIFVERSGRPYTYQIFGGTRLAGGRESINGSGGAVYLPTVGRDTLRLPDTWNLDMRLSREVRLTERARLRGIAEVYNVANHVNYSGVAQRAFLVGTAVNGVTPLVFQDAAAVASEGLNVLPFGTYTAASTGISSERQVELGLRVEF